MAFVTPAFVMAASAVASAAAAGYSAYAQAQAGAYQEKVAQQNAEFQRKLNDSNAARARLDSLASESALADQNRRRLSTLRAAIGAAGVGFGGSPLEIVADSAKNASKDLEYLKWNNSNREYDVQLGGQVAERNYLFDAQQGSFQKQAAFGTLLGGVAQAAGTGAKAYEMYKAQE